MVDSRFSNPYRVGKKSNRLYEDDTGEAKNTHFFESLLTRPNVGYLDPYKFDPLKQNNDFNRKVRSLGTWERAREIGRIPAEYGIIEKQGQLARNSNDPFFARMPDYYRSAQSGSEWAHPADLPRIKKQKNQSAPDEYVGDFLNSFKEPPIRSNLARSKSAIDLSEFQKEKLPVRDEYLSNFDKNGNPDRINQRLNMSQKQRNIKKVQDQSMDDFAGLVGDLEWQNQQHAIGDRGQLLKKKAAEAESRAYLGNQETGMGDFRRMMGRFVPQTDSSVQDAAMGDFANLITKEERKNFIRDKTNAFREKQLRKRLGTKVIDSLAVNWARENEKRARESNVLQTDSGVQEAATSDFASMVGDQEKQSILQQLINRKKAKDAIDASGTWKDTTKRATKDQSTNTGDDNFDTNSNFNDIINPRPSAPSTRDQGVGEDLSDKRARALNKMAASFQGREAKSGLRNGYAALKDNAAQGAVGYGDNSDLGVGSQGTDVQAQVNPQSIIDRFRTGENDNSKYYFDKWKEKPLTNINENDTNVLPNVNDSQPEPKKRVRVYNNLSLDDGLTDNQLFEIENSREYPYYPKYRAGDTTTREEMRQGVSDEFNEVKRKLSFLEQHIKLERLTRENFEKYIDLKNELRKHHVYASANVARGHN